MKQETRLENVLGNEYLLLRTLRSTTHFFTVQTELKCCRAWQGEDFAREVLASRVARFFLVQTYQNGKKYTK
jgi:hypothetical protein